MLSWILSKHLRSRQQRDEAFPAQVIAYQALGMGFSNLALARDREESWQQLCPSEGQI